MPFCIFDYGGDGCISVTANVAQKSVLKYMNSGKGQNYRCHEFKLCNFSLNQMLFVESSPCPVKYALSRMNKCKNILNHLSENSKSNELIIDKVLKNLDLLINFVSEKNQKIFFNRKKYNYEIIQKFEAGLF